MAHVVRLLSRALLRCARSAVPLAIVLAATPAFAAEPAMVDELLQLTGVQVQIERQGKAMTTLRGQRFKNLPAETQQRLDAMFEAAYDPARRLADVRRVLLQEIDRQRGALLLGFFRSPLGRTAVKAEMDATTPEAQAELNAFGLRAKSSPPDPARVALVERYDAAARQVEMGTTQTLATLRTILMLANAALQADKRMPPDLIDKQIEGVRPKVQQQVKDAFLVKGLFVYRNLSDDDLRAYVEFHESDMGRWFVDILARALRDDLQQGIAAAAKLVQEDIQRHDRPCVGLPCAVR